MKNTRKITIDELRNELVNRANEHGHFEAARKLGISRSYLTNILNGDRGISDEVAKALGYRRKDTEYEAIK